MFWPVFGSWGALCFLIVFLASAVAILMVSLRSFDSVRRKSGDRRVVGDVFSPMLDERQDKSVEPLVEPGTGLSEGSRVVEESPSLPDPEPFTPAMDREITDRKAQMHDDMLTRYLVASSGNKETALTRIAETMV